MEDAILDIIAEIKERQRAGRPAPDAAWLDKLVRRHNRTAHDGARRVAKRRLLPFYLRTRAEEPKRWHSWNVDATTEAELLRLLKMKPRRTASGVATVTVITKPWPCSSDCLYCPCDVRMPKSYLAAEPACQRAEHNFFDPYLQVKARLHVLEQMGHVTDKVELIVLGGTWNDYPEDYQRWYVRELFRACNDGWPYAGGPELAAQSGAVGASHAGQRPTDSGASPDNITLGNVATSCNVSPDKATPDDVSPGKAAPNNGVPDNPSDGKVAPSNASPSNAAARNGTSGNASPGNATPGDAAICGAPVESPDPPRDASLHDSAERADHYARCGLSSDGGTLARETAEAQRRVNAGAETYNEAICARLASKPWQETSRFQRASWEEVEAEQRTNEDAHHRVVGLVIETRPDLITPASARTMRRLGCTKIQMGIQSLDDRVLELNRRHVTSDQIARAFAVLRAYGFKLHVHFMANLLGSTTEADRADYRRLVEDPRYCPDEVKLYPCALVESSRLMAAYAEGRWKPYAEDELVGLLVDDVLATPAYVRISRMIRDISAGDIVAGNKKTNLRQMVEAALSTRLHEVREIRMREIATDDVALAELRLDCVSYRTATAGERFLQWVDGEGHIAGFCRLSLPDVEAERLAFGEEPLPTAPRTAMIREVHVYGRVAGIGSTEQGAAQHAGLGKALVEEACRLARAAGYERVAVISAVGTRGYYRTLGFVDAGLYQLRTL